MCLGVLFGNVALLGHERDGTGHAHTRGHTDLLNTVNTEKYVRFAVSRWSTLTVSSSAFFPLNLQFTRHVLTSSLGTLLPWCEQPMSHSFALMETDNTDIDRRNAALLLVCIKVKIR